MRRGLDEFVPGDHNLKCDRTGFKVKASEVAKEWNGLVVRKKSFETRHPQDFVRGVPDRPGVEDARPGPSPDYATQTTSLDVDEGAEQTELSVASTSNMSIGDAIKIAMDNNEWHLATISSFVAGDTVTISVGLTYKASSGNEVIIYNNQPQESAL